MVHSGSFSGNTLLNVPLLALLSALSTVKEKMFINQSGKLILVCMGDCRFVNG